MKRILLLLIISFLGIWQLKSQTTCTDQLRLAQSKFDEGSLDEIPQLIAACMKDGFTKEEKTNAYKLLIQTYLFNEEPEKADQTMLLFLNEFPSYNIAVNDPKEFVNLYRTYRTNPIFKIEISGSGNLSMNSMIQNYGPYDLNTKSPIYKSSFGGSLEINYFNKLYKDFDYSIGTSFTLLRYEYSNNPDDYSTTTGTFSNIQIGLPIAFRYNLKIKNINTFAKAGFEPVYLVSSKISISRRFTNGDNPFSGTLDLISTHKTYDIRPFLALGVAINFSKSQLLISTGIKFSSIAPLKDNALLMDYTSQEKYKFQEATYLTHQTFLSFSFLRSIYKPKKL